MISESYLLHSLNFQKFFLLDEEISKRNSCNLLGLVWSLSLRSLPLEVRLIPKARRRFERIRGVQMNMVVEQSPHYDSTSGEACFLFGICYAQSPLQSKECYMLF